MPKKSEFFVLFEQHAQNAVEASEALEKLFADFTDVENKVRDIHAIEHYGDKLNHEIVRHLNETFVTPLDREDILGLGTKIDDITDVCYDVSELVLLFKVKRVRPAAIRQAKVLVTAAREVLVMLHSLEGLKGLEPHWIKIHTLENEGDQIWREAVGELFAGTDDAIEIVKWKDIHSLVEVAIDRCEVVTQDLVIAALIGAIVWDLITFVAALPTSSSHALIFSVIGAAVSVHGMDVVIVPGLQKTTFGIVYSPLVALVIGYLFMLAIYWALRNVSYRFVNRFFGRAQILSSAYMAFSHGGNDGQKTMGVIALAIYAFHGNTGTFVIDTWVKIVCAIAIGFGTATGGWRIIRTMGMRITALKPVNGFAAETAAATVIEIATRLGIPISTTHAISGAILGVGATRRLSAVRW